MRTLGIFLFLIQFSNYCYSQELLNVELYEIFKKSGFNEKLNILRIRPDLIEEAKDDLMKNLIFSIDSTDDIIKPAIENFKKDYYVSLLFGLMLEKLRSYSEGQQKHFEQDKELLSEHAYKLLFSMAVFISHISETALRTAVSQTGIWAVDLEESWDSAWNPVAYAEASAKKHFESSDLSAAAMLTKKIRGQYHVDAKMAIENIENIVSVEARKMNSPYKMGGNAYFASELASLVYHLKFFDKIVTAIYESDIDTYSAKMIKYKKRRIFSSSKSWSKFKKNHFYVKGPKDTRYHFPDRQILSNKFLEPWLITLDQVVKQINSLEK